MMDGAVKAIYLHIYKWARIPIVLISIPKDSSDIRIGFKEDTIWGLKPTILDIVALTRHK